MPQRLPALPRTDTAAAIRRTAQIVQHAFPRIYLSCHTRHQRRRSTTQRLSPRDADILAHLDEHHSLTPRVLAKHLGVSRSTLSEALKRLARLGYVTPAKQNGADAPRRMERVLLTGQGAAAMHDASVLETERLERMLRQLSEPALRHVSAAFTALGAVCGGATPEARDRRGTPR